MKKVKVAIIGGRDFTDFNFMKKSIFSIMKLKSINKIISGGAAGADILGEMFAEEFNIETEIFNADWNKYGRSAGMIRNKDIINNCDCIFAFWNGRSKGTLNSIELAKKLKKPIKIFKY